MIVTPIAEVVARAASHECWVSARLDPATAMRSLTPGSSVPQTFDHLADRNLGLINKHADGPARRGARPPFRLRRQARGRPTHDPDRDRHRRHVHRRRGAGRGDRRLSPPRPRRRRPTRRRGSWPASASPRPARRDGAERHRRRRHGTTVATNQLLEGRVGRLGFITTEGYEFLLEIARQSVPDGYGNSYFWVKPPRIVPGRPGPRRSAAGWTSRGARSAPFDERRRARRPAGSAEAGITHHRRLLPALLRQRRARAGDARGPAPRSTPTRSCRSPPRCCAEYREYERSMTTLVDAAVKPSRPATSPRSATGSTRSPARRASRSTS